MFDTGNAIKYLKDDRLNRDKFAENIGDAILKSQSTESFVIGLIGKWGSGKTSIVNMVIDHLNKSASYKPGKKPVIVEFNPWNFSDQNQLVSQFFNKLSVSLGRNNSSEDLEDVADLLKKLGKIFILGKYLPVPVLSQFITASADVCEAAGDATESLSKLLEEDLSAIKSEISNILEKQDKKVIIVMDDIDRLNDSEIRQVFQLVKSLADFPNTVYLLTFDREVVVKALDRDQLKCGDEYLEKIVQVPIEIPLLLKPDLEVILCDGLKKLIESESINENDIIRWNNIYDSGFKYFFENLRDVTRYINVLKFYFEIVKGKVNPIDFFAITAIQVFSPDVYQRIRENKSVFAGSFTQFHDMYREEYKETLSSIIESSNESTKKFLKEYLIYLFPKIIHFTGNSSDGFLTVDQSRRDRLICNEDFFDLYFSFSLPKGEIYNEEIESILNSVDNPETLSAKLEELSSKKFLGFLSIIPGYLDNIQEDDVKFMVTVLMDLGDHFSKDELYSYNNYKVIHDCINLLLSKLEDEGEKFVILENSFKNATRSLCTIVNEMHYLRNAHDKYYGKEIYKYSTRIILNVDQLKTLEDVVSKKLKDKAENRDLDIHPNIAYILKRWKLLGAKEEEINNVISRIIQNEDKLINFISSCMFVPRNNCIFENKIEFDISLVEEFMNLEEVESSMKKFDFSGDLWGMNEREKLIVKHFLVNVENAKKSNEKPLIGTIKQEHF